MSGIALPAYMRPERPVRDNALWIAVGVSVLAHVALFVILSLFRVPPPPPPPAPMDVTIADDVGLVATAPQNVTPPAQSRAPELGAPEDAAPAAPAPEPEPVPAKPKPVEAAPAPKPAEIAKPQPKKPVPPQPAKPQTRPAPSGALAGIVGRGGGTTPGATTRTPRGSSLGGVMSGLGKTPNNSMSSAPQAVMTGAAMMDIRSKILQRVQPCADRQVKPGPGAERIKVGIRLRINRDGTLGARPTIEDVSGVDDDNARYVQRVKDSAIATFMGCQPLRGLPADLYDVPNGWSNFLLRYKLPG